MATDTPTAVGCTDHNCLLRLERRGGQGTNGGCRCLSGLSPEARLAVLGWRREVVAARAAAGGR